VASDFVLDFSLMTMIRVMGRSPDRVMQLMEDTQTGERLALTSFTGRKDVDNCNVFIREVGMLIRLRHPCIVPIIGFSLPTPDSPAQIATEYAARGSLRDALKQRRDGLAPLFMDDTGIAIIVCGIVLGMNFIHSQNVIHRHLEPVNIFVDVNGLRRIGDVGSCRIPDFDTTLTNRVGGPMYMAAEMYMGSLTQRPSTSIHSH
jgi:serine/threonine protein kinase